MGRGNDAIPSWSGFNYQGKMMLLHVLESINQININNDKRKYAVELEKLEDFSIICDSRYKSFHQVKAYLSKNKWKDYEPAMDKLLKHKDESGNPTAKCYLTVAKEIENWDDSDNPYKVNIEVYKRKSKIIGVCDVRDEINEEISIYLKDESSDNVIEVVYAELCLFLDERIATLHRQKSKERDYTIDFADIIEVIEAAVEKDNVRNEFYLKEKIYEYIVENIEQSLNDLCKDECSSSLEICNEECAAKNGYEKIMKIVDYGKFCKILNPSKIKDWDNELALVNNFPSDKIQSEIYGLLYQSKTPEKVTGDNCAIYLQSEYSHAPNKQIIPTLLDLTRGVRKEQTLQNIFQNIIKNTDVIDVLEGNSITVIPGNYSGFLSQSKITSGWKKSYPDNVGGYYRDIELISIRELKENFKKNGGNRG